MLGSEYLKYNPSSSSTLFELTLIIVVKNHRLAYFAHDLTMANPGFPPEFWGSLSPMCYTLESPLSALGPLPNDWGCELEGTWQRSLFWNKYHRQDSICQWSLVVVWRASAANSWGSLYLRATCTLQGRGSRLRPHHWVHSRSDAA